MLKTLPFAAIREIADACAETAKRHGWHEEVDVGPYLRALVDTAEAQMKVPPDIINVLRAYGKQLERARQTVRLFYLAFRLARPLNPTPVAPALRQY